MLVAFMCIAAVNRSLNPLRSVPVGLLESLSLYILAVTITLSLYFVDTNLDSTVQVRGAVPPLNPVRGHRSPPADLAYWWQSSSQVESSHLSQHS
jgi:hypothetical protein